MGYVSHWWILLALMLVLIFFGPGRLPQIGGAVGQAIREFRKGTGGQETASTSASAVEDGVKTPPA